MSGFASLVLSNSDWTRGRPPTLEPADVRLLKDAAFTTPTTVDQRRYPRFPAWTLAGADPTAPPRNKSTRQFAPTSLPRNTLDALLASAGARHYEHGTQYAVPSAGAIRSCLLFVAPLHVENCETDLLYVDTRSDIIQSLWPVTGDDIEGIFRPQGWIADSAAVVFIAVDFDAYERVYSNRGLRFGLLEAGSLAQSLYATAARLELDACLVGGFDDTAASNFLDLRGSERLCIALACGLPRDGQTP